jgi:hypothetical protein
VEVSDGRGVAIRGAACGTTSTRGAGGGASRKRKRGGNWRRRAGDARPSSSSVETAGIAMDEATTATAARFEAEMSAVALRAALRLLGLIPGGATKAKLAARLARAQRAEAAARAVYAEHGPPSVFAAGPSLLAGAPPIAVPGSPAICLLAEEPILAFAPAEPPLPQTHWSLPPPDMPLPLPHGPLSLAEGPPPLDPPLPSLGPLPPRFDTLRSGCVGGATASASAIVAPLRSLPQPDEPPLLDGSPPLPHRPLPPHDWSLPPPHVPLPPRFDTIRAGCVGGATRSSCCLCSGPIPPPRRSFCCDECVHSHSLRTSGAHVRKAVAIRDKGVCAMCRVDAAAAHASARKAVAAAVAAARGSGGLRGSVARGSVGKDRVGRGGGGNGPKGGSGADAADHAAAALRASVAFGPFESCARLTLGRRPRVSAGSFWQADHLVPVAEGGGCCGMENLRTLCAPCHAQVTAGQAAGRARQRARGGGGSQG